LPTQAFEQRLLEEMNENPALEAGKEEEDWKDEFENEDYDDYDDAESERIEAEDINIDEYLSNDETLIIKHKVITLQWWWWSWNTICCSVSFHQDLINQLNTFILMKSTWCWIPCWQYWWYGLYPS
jgi:RNA polymerase sigma-54 factor